MNRRIVAIAVMAMSLFASVGLSTASAASSATTNTGVCSGLDSGKIDIVGQGPATLEISKPGYVITGYCVKAGSDNQEDGGPEYVPVNPPQTTVVIEHSTGKGISHYSYSFAKAATATAPTFSDVCGPDNEVVTIPTAEGVSYSQNTAGNVITVTATALPGYVLVGPSSWTFEFSDAACATTTTTVTATAPSFTDLCGPDNEVLTIPNTTGVSYAQNTVGNVITVTATALPGHVLAGQTSWTFTVNDAACGTTTTAPADVCANINGVQTTVPAGMEQTGTACNEVLGEQASNNNNNNNGNNNNNAGNEAENNTADNVDVLGEQAAAAPAQAVPTVVNAGLAGESTNVVGSAAMLALLGAMLGLLALGARAATAAGRRQG